MTEREYDYDTEAEQRRFQWTAGYSDIEPEHLKPGDKNGTGLRKEEQFSRRRFFIKSVVRESKPGRYELLHPCLDPEGNERVVGIEASQDSYVNLERWR